MKKYLFIILLFVLFIPSVVNADEMKITDYYVSVVKYSEDIYETIENYKTNLKFSDVPSTYYFQREILTNDNFYYTNKEVPYKKEIYDIKVTTDKKYFLNSDSSDKLVITFGQNNVLLNESEEFGIKYKTKFTGNKLNLNKYFVYDIISNVDYDIDKLNFIVLLDVNIKDKKILFSLNKKDYKTSLDGLDVTFDSENENIIKGNYKNIIEKGDTLSIKIILEQDDIISNYKEIIVYVSIALVFISLIVVTIVMIRKKHRK